MVPKLREQAAVDDTYVGLSPTQRTENTTAYDT
jgi:hypothetical protein